MAQLPNLGVSGMVRSVTGTVTTVLESADLLSSYINKVKQDQIVDHKIHRAQYEEVAITTAAKQYAERMIELEQFAAKSEDHQIHLQNGLDKFKAVLASK